MNLIPIVAFSQKDHTAAARMLYWCAHLCGQQPNTVVLAYEPETPSEAVLRAASRAFATVEHLPVRSSWDAWPGSANDYFAITAAAMRTRGPWLWLEPDCVPIRPGWLAELEADFQRCGKLALGAFIPAWFERNGTYEKVGDMVAGVAVYHQSIWDQCPVLRSLRAYNAEHAKQKVPPMAFDCRSRHEFLRVGGATALIQHMGRSNNFRREGGGIVCTYAADGKWSNVVSREAGLIHGVKDDSLINLLRAEMGIPERNTQSVSDRVSAIKTAGFFHDEHPSAQLQTHEFIAPNMAGWGDEAKIPPEIIPLKSEPAAQQRVACFTVAAAVQHPADSAKSKSLSEARKAISHWPECRQPIFTLQQKIGRYRVACQCGAMSPKLPEGLDWEAAWEAQPKVVDEAVPDEQTPTAGVEQVVARQSHKLEAVGASPTPDTEMSPSGNGTRPGSEFTEGSSPSTSTTSKRRKKYKPRRKKTARTPEAQAAINQRMAAMRAKRVTNKAHQQEAARTHH